MSGTKLTMIMKILKIYKVAHSGEIIGTLSSQARKHLKVRKIFLAKLIEKGFVVVDRVEMPDDTDLAVAGRAVYNG